MDEKDFKKHLADLAHGHHHPEEHDWEPNTAGDPTRAKTAPTPKKKTTIRKARKKS
jgi:hypothetical protein